MLLLNPRRLTFGSETWGNVASVTIERKAERSITEFSDAGQHVVLADVPEQRVTVQVVQELLGDDMDEPKPGETGTLSFTTAPNSSGANRRSVSMTAVILGVSYQVSQRGSSRRVVDLVAVSSDGTTDPVTVAAV